MLKLVRIETKLYNEYKEMMDEWVNSKTDINPWVLKLPYETLEEFKNIMQRVNELEKGINLGDYPQSTTYLLIDENTGKVIGASNLRHYLKGSGSELWGHIGYGIRPSMRNKGYAKELLKLTLIEAKKLNLNEVLLGAYENNIASNKVIVSCNGKLFKKLIDKETNKEVNTYIINI